mmetsp:Transcript_9260/g.23402  ORF Transcript_9260/g.23402 Transcript_9260/m.23402 type:complete len:295 (-) Transcript_9260:2330-3214(-)
MATRGSTAPASAARQRASSPVMRLNSATADDSCPSSPGLASLLSRLTSAGMAPLLTMPFRFSALYARVPSAPAATTLQKLLPRCRHCTSIGMPPASAMELLQASSSARIWSAPAAAVGASSFPSSPCSASLLAPSSPPSSPSSPSGISSRCTSGTMAPAWAMAARLASEEARWRSAQAAARRAPMLSVDSSCTRLSIVLSVCPMKSAISSSSSANMLIRPAAASCASIALLPSSPSLHASSSTPTMTSIAPCTSASSVRTSSSTWARFSRATPAAACEVISSCSTLSPSILSRW